MDLLDRIVADWQIGKVDNNNPEFEGLIFALPVTCVMCNRFISKEVEALVDKEVQYDKARKLKENPKWIARDWDALRSVVQKSW